MVLDGDVMTVFFTCIGDAPESLYMARVPLHGDWTDWRAEPAVEVLRPGTAYEGMDLPEAPSGHCQTNLSWH